MNIIRASFYKFKTASCVLIVMCQVCFGLSQSVNPKKQVELKKMQNCDNFINDCITETLNHLTIAEKNQINKNEILASEMHLHSWVTNHFFQKKSKLTNCLMANGIRYKDSMAILVVNLVVKRIKNEAYDLRVEIKNAVKGEKNRIPPPMPKR